MLKTSRKQIITIAMNLKNYFKPTAFTYFQIYWRIFFIKLSRIFLQNLAL